MPLSAKGRIEVYIPTPTDENSSQLLAALEEEFTFNFGGCSIIRGVSGRYLADDGTVDEDAISLIYTDSPYEFEKNLKQLTQYMKEIREYVSEALSKEESILVAAYSVFHSD